MPAGGHLPHLLAQRRARRASPPTSSAPAGCTASSARGSRSPRRPAGPRSASTAATTGSSPTGWTSAPPGPITPRQDELRLLFVGRADARKGLPVLLRAFEALRHAGVPARLTVAGATAEEVEPLLLDHEGVDVAGRVTDDEKWRLLGQADVLCAPSLGGESFGMVLTEAFASSTPVVASDIAGYRDVVRDGVDGVLVPGGDAAALGEALHGARARPRPARATGARPRASAPSASRGRAWRPRWPTCTRRRPSCPCPTADVLRAGRRLGLSRRSRARPRRPVRLPSLEPSAPGDGRRSRVQDRAPRRPWPPPPCAGVGLAALALQTIGIESIGHALIAATPVWVLARLRAHVRLDAHPRRGVARDPARRAPGRRACAGATPPAPR